MTSRRRESLDLPTKEIPQLWELPKLIPQNRFKNLSSKVQWNHIKINLGQPNTTTVRKRTVRNIQMKTRINYRLQKWLNHFQPKTDKAIRLPLRVLLSNLSHSKKTSKIVITINIVARATCLMRLWWTQTANPLAQLRIVANHGFHNNKRAQCLFLNHLHSMFSHLGNALQTNKLS